jgi:hypothetical protein
MSLYPESISSKRVQAAVEAHGNLNTFGAVVSILEGGHVYGPTDKSAGRTAAQIIALCRAEQQRQLKAMDKATGRQP